MMRHDSGFIALMSSIIFSVILLLIAVTLSFISFSGRFNILDSEMKERSSALADACVDTGLLKLANDSNYPGNETVIVSGSDTCTIDQVATPGIDPQTFVIHADYKNYITNLRIIVDLSDTSIISWEETPN